MLLTSVRRAGALLLALALLLTGACSSDDTSDEATTDDSTPSEAGVFPVTVPSEMGDVTVDEAPERVVALGWSDAETALALGVQPVGAADWLEFGGNGVGPWAADLYDEEPQLLDTEIDYEAVAALQPDLILNTVSDADAEAHELLSQIAPTVGVPVGAGAWSTTWQDQMASVSAALGLPDEGDVQVAETEDLFERARAEHPEFDGATVTVGARFGEQYGAYVSTDSRMALMEQLGFVSSPAVEELATDSFYIPVSPERLDLFDADLTVMFPFSEADLEAMQGDQLLQGIPSAQDGRMVVLDDEDLVRGFSAASVLSNRYVLEHGVPLFAAGVAGEAGEARSS